MIFEFEKFGSKEGFILGNDNALPAWAIVVIVAIIFSAIVAVVSVICCYKLITKYMDQKNANKSTSSKHQAIEEGQTDGKQILEQHPGQLGNVNLAVANPQIESRQNINTTPTSTFQIQHQQVYPLQTSLPNEQQQYNPLNSFPQLTSNQTRQSEKDNQTQ
ncbi:MAG: hypothetical protein EZS28_024465 [Streblomastix strix]|uniref:Uncharacterized protein n=1 Tax=Streblomastix strix TaxID=222440 RepID=A0A5J4VBR0_9EUKA|nr:MAG: hypothetical protein EZS28_024465 [Streblomastix strix]